MLTEELLSELFETEVDRLGRASGLSEAERKRIIGVYREAIRNPYMDERLIFPALIGKETLTP